MTEDKITFEFDVSRTAHSVPLEFRVLHNGTVVHQAVSDQNHVVIEIADEDADHEIVFELAGKQHVHTKIDENNHIVEDAVITVSNIVIDSIDSSEIFFSQSQYQHNFNGNGPQTVDPFYGTMGCNGTVIFRFSTPIYLWLLEHM